MSYSTWILPDGIRLNVFLNLNQILNMRTVNSTCIYCGCGCRLNYQVEGRKIVKILPDKSDEVSEGKPCIKGLTINEVVDKGRNLYPLIRKDKKSKFRKVSWQKAYDFIYKNTYNLAPEEVFFVPSGKITNEDDYIIQKFARIVFKTNNIDSCCSRLCHAATVKGLHDTFGISSTPWKMNDVYDVDCLLIIGSNPITSYPVFFNRISKIKNRGTKIISIQTITNLISQYSDFALIIQPGTETALLNGIINVLIKNKSYDKKVEKLDGFRRLKDVVKKYTINHVCDLCGIKKRQMEELIEIIENSENFAAFHGMGLTQHVNAIENVHSLLNLVNLKNGKLLSLRGEINVQGVGDMGCSPDILPIDSFISSKELEKMWRCELSKEKGKNVLEAFLISPVKAAFISGFNPAQSLPNLTDVHRNLKKIFLICLDSYSNLTSKFANVVLPTPILIERTGTITNGERRVRFVRRVLKPLGNSKPDWLIFKELSKLFGQEKHFNFNSEKQIFEEIVRTIPAYSIIDARAVYNGKDAWANKEIKFIRFIPEEFEGTEDARSSKYPFLLTTFRSQYHFLTGEATSKSKTLRKSKDGPYCYLNSDDAKRLKIKDGDRVKISSHVSSITAKANISEKIPKGIVAMHFHFESLLVNKLFPTQFDEETFTPNYKMVAVRIEKD
ncbi:MAG: molybdopterin oxidoreductase family protein [Candidatus Heimdallarchaeota archaeon]